MIFSDQQVEAVIDLRDGGDWSLDLCFAGLVKNLGCNRVVDIPRKHKHREWGSKETSWGLERRTLGYTVDNDRIGMMCEPERLALLNEGGFRRVWLDERMESFQAYRELGFYDAGVPAVIVAGHDRFWNHSPKFVRDMYGSRFEAMLLDNWYPEYGILPFRTKRVGWSINFDHYWNRPSDPLPEKDIDISFIGYNSHPDRARFVDHIEKRWGHLNNYIYLERRPDSFENFVPKALMFDFMSRSKICINLRGAADRGKTLRAYEIPYVGSYMLSQDIDDPGMKDDFVEGVHANYFFDETELDETIEWALSRPIDREEIARVGHNHAVTTLSVRSRWSDVLKWINDG